MNGCDEDDYTITPFMVGNEQHYGVSGKYCGFLAFCAHRSSAELVRDEAIGKARKQTGGR